MVRKMAVEKYQKGSFLLIARARLLTCREPLIAQLRAR